MTGTKKLWRARHTDVRMSCGGADCDVRASVLHTKEMHMDLSTSAILYYSVFAAAGLVVGVLLTAVIAYAMADKARRAREAEEAMTEQIMTGLNRSCEGIESVIATLNLASLNLPKVKKDLFKRIGALEKRVQQYADQVEPFFVAYMALRLDTFRKVIDRIDDLTETVVGFGGQAAPAAAPSDDTADADSGVIVAPSAAQSPAPMPVVAPVAAFAAAAIAPIVQPEPAPAQAFEPPAPPADLQAFGAQPAPMFEPAQEPEKAPEVDVGSTMAFDVNMEPQVAAPEEQMAAEPYPPAAPAQDFPAFAQPQAPAPAQEQGEEDMMYGQTMQFSMSDIEAARKGMEQAPEVQPAVPEFVQAGFEPAPQGVGPAMGDGGETVLFAVDEPAAQPAPAPAPAMMQQPVPQFAAPQPKMPPVAPPQMRPMQAMPQQMAPVQQMQMAQSPAPAAQPKQADSSGNLITGNDLMDQMDAFFNFNKE